MPDKFDFLKRLGAGNFGEVWLARDRALAVERAVKLIPPGRVANPQNLFQESQILKAAQHTNIVRVEEAGTLDDGRIYVSMEYLPKGSIEDEASGNFLPLRRAKQVMIDVLRGMAYAHSKNITHCDLKPANILVGQHGEAKLSDFGLAIATGVAGIQAGTPRDYAYVAHLAPELIDLKKLALNLGQFSPLTDVYAAGVTLYRLVNGDAYFSRVPPPFLIQMIKSGDFPDRKTYRPFVPKSLIKVIDHSLSTKPSDRFQSAVAFRRALEKVDLRTDWEREPLSDGEKWTGRLDDRVFEACIRDQPSGWSVDVRKDRGAGARTVRTLCRETMDQETAEKYLRTVLQKITTGAIE